jgi:hypothetical protein
LRFYPQGWYSIPGLTHLVLFFLSNLTDTDLSMALGSIVSGVPLVKSQRVEFDAVHAVMLFDH